MATKLNIWMNGQLVGQWRHTPHGRAAFQYDPTWVGSDYGRPLSVSIPFTAGNKAQTGTEVEAFFENLLPDSKPIRDRMRTRHRIRSEQTMDLLEAIGRDCVGAAMLLAPDKQPPAGWQHIVGTELTDAQVAQLLREVPTIAMGAPDGDFRISIAGAQEKTALLRFGGKWYAPSGATPTTHILKLPLGVIGGMQLDLRHSVENEWLCAQILDALDLNVAKTDMADFEDQRVLVVERFDRRWINATPEEVAQPGFQPQDGVWIARLPQEDFCQASGLPPSMKYAEHGGPGMKQCLSLLAKSSHPRADQRHFCLSQLAFWLLAATDGHAKNFSIFIEPGGSYRLTPLYDVLSAWPVIGHGANRLPIQKAKLAMGVPGKTVHYRIRDIYPRHWQALAAMCLDKDVWEHMRRLVNRAPAVLREIEKRLPAGFPTAVSQPVFDGVRDQALRFQNALLGGGDGGDGGGVDPPPKASPRLEADHLQRGYGQAA